MDTLLHPNILFVVNNLLQYPLPNGIQLFQLQSYLQVEDIVNN